MPLAQTVLLAVSKVRSALGNLIIPMTLVVRVKQDYTPGQKQEYTDINHTSDGAITKYSASEIDGTMIQALDAQIIFFPPISKAIPKPDDHLIANAETFRVVSNQPVYAGSEIALHVVQVRPA